MRTFRLPSLNATSLPLTALFQKSQANFYFVIIAVVHLAIALFYKEVIGFQILEDVSKDWDWFWQLLPVQALRTDLLRSIWYLHAQPPLYNMIGAAYIKLFYPNHLEYLYYGNIILGALMSGMLYQILFQFTHNRRLSLIVAFILALSPAIFLYEAYLLYTLFTAFLVTASVFFLSQYKKHPKLRHVIAFIVVLNVLVLTRSLYHLIFLIPGIFLTLILAQKQWKRMLAIALIISAFSFGWYAKNHYLFGFWGGSSWSGQNLWRIASFKYETEELEQLADMGVVQPAMAKLDAFNKPSAYVDLGFNQTSAIEVLSLDDFNNINIIAISRMYQANAIQLIGYDPGHYLRNVLYAYILYTKPTSRYTHLSFPDNAAKTAQHEALSADIFQGAALARRTTGFDFGLFMFFLLPLSLIFYLLSLLKFCGLSLAQCQTAIRSDAPMLFAAWLIFYTTVVSIAVEMGENDRFTFLIEQILWAFIICVIYRQLRYDRRKSRYFRSSNNP